MLNYQNHNLLHKLLIAYFCFLAIGVQAQVNTIDENTAKDNSPYSRIGLGDLINPNFASSLGMGGLGATYNDPLQANLVNPASLPYLRTASFEVGARVEYSRLTSNDTGQDVWNGNINHLSLSFPLRNPINEELDRKNPDTHWGMNISLLPYSTVGYDARAESITDEDVDVTTYFSGRGGTYKVQWGNGVKYKDWSIGVNIGHHFGELINERDVIFADTTTGYDNKLLDKISISGFYWNVGLMYKHQYKKMEKGELVPNGKSLTVGVYGNSKNTINSNTNRLYQRQYRLLPPTAAADTIVFDEGLKGDIILPSSFGFGVMYENENKLRLGLDFSMQNWSEYRNDAKPERLDNSFRIAAGGEYIPDINSYNSYRKKVHYRFGAYYSNDPRNINEQLTDYGITLGMGLPVILPRQAKSYFNFSLEVGQFGTSSSFKETYVRANFAFTLNDNSWFYKRKFQ